MVAIAVHSYVCILLAAIAWQELTKGKEQLTQHATVVTKLRPDNCRDVVVIRVCYIANTLLTCFVAKLLPLAILALHLKA